MSEATSLRLSKVPCSTSPVPDITVIGTWKYEADLGGEILTVTTII